MKATSLLLIHLFTFFLPAFSREDVIPFEYFQRVIFLNVTVNETDNLLFLFDTGANTSSIDEHTLEKLDLPFVRTDLVEVNGTLLNVALVKADELRIGNASIRNMELAVENLSYSLAPAGRHIDGILGTDFMKNFIVGIDFVKQKISFSTKSNCKSGFIPFEMDNNFPKIKVTINDTIHMFLRYDSGSSQFDTASTFGSSTIENWIALQVVDSLLRPVRYFNGTATGTVVQLSAVRVRTFFFTGQKIKYPYIFVQPRQGHLALPDAMGFFGNNLFEKFERVSIDFPANRICFPGQE